MTTTLEVAEQLADELYGLHCDIGRLEVENAKLRELLRDMFRDFANCDYELKTRCGRTFMAVTRYESHLRELGVEVDA